MDYFNAVGHLDIVKTLINADANINAKDNHGYLSLIWTSNEGYIEIVTVLTNTGSFTLKNKHNLNL